MIPDLLAEMDAYCAARGIRLSTLSRYAAGDSRFYERMEAGRECLPRTVEKVRRYMAEHPAEAAAAAGAEQARSAA